MAVGTAQATVAKHIVCKHLVHIEHVHRIAMCDEQALNPFTTGLQHLSVRALLLDVQQARL